MNTIKASAVVQLNKRTYRVEIELNHMPQIGSILRISQKNSERFRIIEIQQDVKVETDGIGRNRGVYITLEPDTDANPRMTAEQIISSGFRDVTL